MSHPLGRQVPALAMLACLASVATGQDPRAAFLTEYEPHAVGLRDAYTNVSCRLKRTGYTNAGRAYPFDDYAIKYNFRNCQIDGSSRFVDDAGVERVAPSEWSVQNSRYGFELRAKPGGGDRVITALTPAVDSPFPILNQLCHPYANFLPAGRSYLAIARDPQVKVLSYSDQQWRGHAVKQLIAEFSTGAFGTSTAQPFRLAFAFRPDLRWVCVGCRSLSLTEPGKLVWEDIMEYGPPVDGWPCPTRFEKRIYNDNSLSQGRLYITTDITNFARSPVPFPDSDFTLAAFGFPEPESLPERRVPDPLRPLVGADVLAPPLDMPSRQPLWLASAVGGVTLIGVGLAVRQRLRRRRAAAT